MLKKHYSSLHFLGSTSLCHSRLLYPSKCGTRGWKLQSVHIGFVLHSFLLTVHYSMGAPQAAVLHKVFHTMGSPESSIPVKEMLLQHGLCIAWIPSGISAQAWILHMPQGKMCPDAWSASSFSAVCHSFISSSFVCLMGFFAFSWTQFHRGTNLDDGLSCVVGPLQGWLKAAVPSRGHRGQSLTIQYKIQLTELQGHSISLRSSPSG